MRNISLTHAPDTCLCTSPYLYTALMPLTVTSTDTQRERERGGEGERFGLHEVLEIISTVSERERLRTYDHTYIHTCHGLDAIHRHFHSGCRRVGRQCQYLERHPHSHAHALPHTHTCTDVWSSIGHKDTQIHTHRETERGGIYTDECACMHACTQP